VNTYLNTNNNIISVIVLYGRYTLLNVNYIISIIVYNILQNKQIFCYFNKKKLWKYIIRTIIRHAAYIIIMLTALKGHQTV